MKEFEIAKKIGKELTDAELKEAAAKALGVKPEKVGRWVVVRRSVDARQEILQNLVKNGCICVAEGANMPTTPDAIRVIQDAGLLYSPGKASNAGGVATSGLEMSQNSMRQSWTAEEVDQYLRRIMQDIHAACVKYGTREDGTVNYVKGANIAGFIKVAGAMSDQGLV